MLISKVRLKNGYKRFHDLTIDLGPNPKRIIALVGPNGCGKSSVLDGLLYHASVYGRIGENSIADPNYHSMTGSNGVTFDDVQIDFVNGSYSKVFRERNDTGGGNSIFSFRSPYRYNLQLKVSETRAVSEIRTNSYGASNASSLDAKVDENYRRLLAYFNNYRDKHDLKPSEAKARIIGALNESIGRCLDIQVSSMGNVEGNQRQSRHTLL